MTALRHQFRVADLNRSPVNILRDLLIVLSRGVEQFFNLRLKHDIGDLSAPRRLSSIVFSRMHTPRNTPSNKSIQSYPEIRPLTNGGKSQTGNGEVRTALAPLKPPCFGNSVPQTGRLRFSSPTLRRRYETTGPTPDDLRAKVFEDRERPGDWRVEKMDEDGGYDVVKVFTGPDAREKAIRYAEREFGELTRSG